MIRHFTDVLAYWFGDIDSPEARRKRFPIWFQGGAQADREITTIFGDTLEAASNMRLNDWALSPRGRLALIIVLDQFSRNVFRGTPRAFAQDAQALQLTLQGLRNQHGKRLAPLERAFLYMPLEHDENLGSQERCVELFRSLVRETPWPERSVVEGFLDFAEKHEVIIRRFGRFPHRNAILGRTSTPEEIEFLKQPGSSF